MERLKKELKVRLQDIGWEIGIPRHCHSGTAVPRIFRKSVIS